MTLDNRFKIVLIFLFILFSQSAFCQLPNTWIRKNDIPVERHSAVSFSIDGKVYVGTGSTASGTGMNDFWEFDPATNAWTQKASLPGAIRSAAVGFSIGLKGYIGLGSNNGTLLNDFWEYDPAANSWTQKTNFPGTARRGAIGFSIDQMGYVGTGMDGMTGPGGGANYRKDFYEFDAANNSWTQKADFEGTAREQAVGFSIGTKGYVGTGYDTYGSAGPYKKDFWEYDPAANDWIQKTDFGGDGRFSAIGLSLGNKGYIGTGTAGTSFGQPTNDFWEYDPAGNNWTQKANAGSVNRSYAVAASVGTNAYVSTGFATGQMNAMWEYSRDGGPPSLISRSPADNAVDVPPADWVSVTFDRNIIKGTGDILLRRTSDNVIVWTTPLTSIVDVKINGATAEILLPFEGNSNYYIEIPATAFKDAQGNFFTGITGSSAWNFATLADNIPPTVTARTPVHTATNVLTNTTLNLTFNEAIQFGTGNILVKQAHDDATVLSVNVSNASPHLTKTSNALSISAPLKASTTYYVVIPASAISDGFGNYFAGYTTSTSWTFSTTSTPGVLPLVTSRTPQDNSTGIIPGDWVYLIFDKPVSKGSGNILLRKTIDNSIAWTTPLTSVVDVKINGASVEILLPHEGNSAYYIEIPNTAFKDANNNYFEGFSSPVHWNFATFIDTTAPVIALLTPANNSTQAATNTLLSIDFNERIEPGIGNIVLKRVSDDATILSADVTNPGTSLQFSNNGLTLSAPLVANTSYYVIIPATAVSDIYNNSFAGITSATGWTFSTAQQQGEGPAITSLTPADNAVSVSAGDWVSVSFTKNIARGFGNIYLKRVSDNSIAYTTPLTSVDVKINGASAEILLPHEKNERYYVDIPASAFKDANNNYFAGTTSTTTWNFETVFDAPQITAFTPSSAVEGATVTITGTNLKYTSSVLFGGTPAASFTLDSPTKISAVVAAGATGSISVTNPGGTVVKTGFTFLAPPVVNSFSPAASKAGGTVVITGTGFTGATAVKFGATSAASFQVNSDTQISAVVATGTSGEIEITTAIGTGKKTGFTFIPAPVITSFSPATASEGETVTITGSNFTGVTSVTFGGSAANSFSVSSATTLTAVVASGASGDVVIVSPGGEASASGFLFKQRITGIEEKNGNAILDIHPNPSRGDYLYIRLPEAWKEQRAQASLLDITGKILTTKELACCDNVRWDIGNEVSLTGGLYFLSVTTNGKRIVAKVFVDQRNR